MGCFKHKNCNTETEKANARADYLARHKRREQRAAATRNAVIQRPTDRSVFTACAKAVTRAMNACMRFFRKVG